MTENVWFAESFGFFGRDNYTVGLLPEDHHELAGLVAPRGLYSTENVGFLWLGDWSGKYAEGLSGLSLAHDFAS